MKRTAAPSANARVALATAGLLAAIAAAGCQTPTRPAPGGTATPSATATAADGTPQPEPKVVYVDRPVPQDEVVATVAGREIRFSQLREPLLKAHGLAVLLNVVQLELAKAEADKRGLTVTATDVEAETRATLQTMFPDTPDADLPRLLEQLLQQQRLTRAEFDMVMTINAYLRKIALSMMTDPPSEATLQEAFGVLYGETVRVRHIACANLQEVGEAQRRLQAGVPFESVARELSRNPRTAPLGGELPPFSRAATDISEVFKETAFSLKEGEVSDPVQAEGFYHLIKLEKRIPPKAVKFEDVRESIREELTRRASDAAVREFRQTLAAQARESLTIREPILAEQWRQRLQAAERTNP
ncbi:MAG: peptidylprolyl isomerase [Tepidisphaerales bacterium]